MSDYFLDGSVSKAPPIKRAAYSDRTAWLLAELSRLVYEPLPDEVTVTKLVDEIKAAVEKGEHRDAVEALVKRAVQHFSSENGDIAAELRRANLELIEPFAADGTEAILVKLNPHDGFDGMLILAFRGTQPGIKDVATDIKANLVPAPGGGRVHRGFLESFENVKTRVSNALSDHAGLPVYITGHSLGGALAMVATRYLGSDSTGATYTYGCPRAADDGFYESIRTPVYRVVNAADGVTRVPFGYFLVLVLSLIRLLPINGTRRLSEWIRRNFAGYTHYGNLVFLSAPPNVPDEKGRLFKGLMVKKSPDIFWRVSLVLKRIISTRGKALASDHSIREYSQKLLAYAQRRNDP
jgi:hypothetical protein